MLSKIRAFCSILFFFIAPTWAQSAAQIPNPQQTSGSWIYDGAQVLSPAQKERLDSRIDALKSRTGSEIAIVTLHSLNGQNERNLAFDLFNRWGVGQRGRDNGALVLVAIRDRKYYVEVGYGLEQLLTDTRTGELAREQLVPAFRAGNYALGLGNLTEAIARTIENDRELGQNSGATSPSGTENRYASPQSRPSSGFSLWPILVFCAPVLLLIFAKTRPRRCRVCDVVMEKVPAHLEEPHLSNVQEFEQHLGGRDWLVWRCPKCEIHETEAKDSWFSGIETCARCGNKTARRQSQILKPPTRGSEGLEEITHSCKWPECRHTRVERRRIPRLPPPPSSSGHSGGIGGFSGGISGRSSGGSSRRSSGSFGGGRSGGGGAGGSW